MKFRMVKLTKVGIVSGSFALGNATQPRLCQNVKSNLGLSPAEENCFKFIHHHTLCSYFYNLCLLGVSSGNTAAIDDKHQQGTLTAGVKRVTRGDDLMCACSSRNQKQVQVKQVTKHKDSANSQT